MKLYSDIEQKRIIADNLQDLIKKSNKDQRDIALDLDVNPPTFNQWVTGKATPTVSTLRKVADYFKVSLSYIVNKHSDLEEDENNVEVLPIESAIKYSKLDTTFKQTVIAAIEKSYEQQENLREEYNRVMSLNEITDLEDAKVILGHTAAFGGYATDEELLAMANTVLKMRKK